MGRNIGLQCRECRTERKKLFLKGERCYSAKCPISKKRGMPGKSLKSKPGKLSDYGLQLREKQKLKRMYGMLEKQFSIFFEKASKMHGKTGDNLLQMLERRLDNIIFRMRFASSRRQGRQFVTHGHVTVNGKKVNIPSFLVKAGDEVEIKDKSKKVKTIKESLKEYTKSGVVMWLEVDPDNLKGKVKSIPARQDITDLSDIKEQLIVELYSK